MRGGNGYVYYDSGDSFKNVHMSKLNKFNTLNMSTLIICQL